MHTGAESQAAAAAVGARAFTVGQDVHFASGEYQPGTHSGDQLIAHELDKYDGEFYRAEYKAFKDGTKTKDDLVQSVLSRKYTSGANAGKTVRPRRRIEPGACRLGIGS